MNHCEGFNIWPADQFDDIEVEVWDINTWCYRIENKHKEHWTKREENWMEIIRWRGTRAEAKEHIAFLSRHQTRSNPARLTAHIHTMAYAAKKDTHNTRTRTSWTFVSDVRLCFYRRVACKTDWRWPRVRLTKYYSSRWVDQNILISSFHVPLISVTNRSYKFLFTKLGDGPEENQEARHKLSQIDYSNIWFRLRLASSHPISIQICTFLVVDSSQASHNSCDDNQRTLTRIIVFK